FSPAARLKPFSVLLHGACRKARSEAARLPSPATAVAVGHAPAGGEGASDRPHSPAARFKLSFGAPPSSAVWPPDRVRFSPAARLKPFSVLLHGACRKARSEAARLPSPATAVAVGHAPAGGEGASDRPHSPAARFKLSFGAPPSSAVWPPDRVRSSPAA